MEKIKPTLFVEFYSESNGREPVRIWLQSLDKAVKIILGEDISKVQFRWPLGMPLVRSLGEGIYELRSHIPNGIIRILFLVTNKTMVLLHGFIKKDTKASYTRVKNSKREGKKL